MLTLIYLDSSRTRRARFAKHFSHRFDVQTAETIADAERLVAQTSTQAVVSYIQLVDGDAFDLAVALRKKSSEPVFLVHGAPELRRKRRVSSKVVDAYSAEVLSPSLMEGLVWNAIVERHAPSERNPDAREWTRLLAIEPLLEQVRPLVKCCQGNGDPLCLARQLQTLLHTRHTQSANTLPFVAVVEGDSAKREAMQNHFAGRLRLFFVVHPRDLVALHRRQSVSAVVFQAPGATASLIDTLRSLSTLHIPMVAHGIERTLPVDRQLADELSLPALEALLWEELTRADPRVLQVVRAEDAEIETHSASLSDDEVARRSSWGDLLTAEANFTNLKRLLMKEIRLGSARRSGTLSDLGPSVERPLSELTWSELLTSNVSRATLTELLTREIHLFPARSPSA